MNILNPNVTNSALSATVSDLFQVNFTTSNDPNRIERVHKIAQIVAKILLTPKGTDSYAPEIGTGILSLRDRFVSATNVNLIKSDIALWISDAQEQIRLEQSTGTFFSDEKISKLSPRSISFDFIALSWDILIDVITESGDIVDIDISPQLRADFGGEVEDINISDVSIIDDSEI